MSTCKTSGGYETTRSSATRLTGSLALVSRSRQPPAISQFGAVPQGRERGRGCTRL